MLAVRVHFVHCDREMATSENYLFDIVTGADGRPRDGMIFFGVWGLFAEPDNLFPVILTEDGEIDLGQAAVTNNEYPRYHRTNIRERKIILGELVTVWAEYEEATKAEVEMGYTLRISRITPLEGV